MDHCPDHGYVVETLGAVKARLDDGNILLGEIKDSIRELRKGQNNGEKTAAVEQTKSKILYWVIGIAAAALITSLVNFGFHIKDEGRFARSHQSGEAHADQGLKK